MADLKNKIIGGFQVLREIQAGSGSQGTVYKAVCTDDRDGLVPAGTVVALKVMVVQDEGRSQWKKLEKRTSELARMDSPNVVRYYGCFSETGVFNDIHVVVQEFLQGETLKERLLRFPSGLDADEALRIADAALAGLVYTSNCGIIHRDIKPGNIFLCDDGTVKLIDFEIARQSGGTTTASVGNLRGSFDYMAPDFTDGGFHGDVKSDVFSMGVVLHEMLTGRTPYQRLEGDDRQANFAFLSRWAHSLTDGYNPIHVSSRVNRLLAHTEEVMARSLAPLRENRYADFQTFREGLKAIRFRNLRSGKNAYQVLQFIGKGGFGEVFKARSRQSGQLVAVKHLLREAYAERFYREAKIMKKLRDPCFVQFVDFFLMDVGSNREAFLVMAFLDGMPGNSLRDAIKNAGEAGLPRRDVLRAFERYARGLQVMHSEGIFHRDIKPSNLYFPAGHPESSAIMDLGIARDVNGTATQGQVPGTLDYMPPEVVISDCRGDGGMDIYALGLCLYEALTTKTGYPRLPTGTAAYTAFFDRAKSKRKPTFDAPGVCDDPELLALLNDMTDPELSRRIRDAGTLVGRLRELEKSRFPDLSDLSEGDPDEAEQTIESGFDEETVAETVVPDGMTQGTVATQWDGTKRKALERERRRIQAQRRDRFARSSRPVLVASVVLVLLVLCAVGFFTARKLACERYARRQMDEIVAEYRAGSDDVAARMEMLWRTRWNPKADSWMKLDETAFAHLIRKLDEVKEAEKSKLEERKVARTEKDRLEALAKIDGCRAANGKLDETAFQKLSGWILPETVGDDGEIARHLSDLASCLASAVREKLAVEPPLTRSGRIRKAKDLLGSPWSERILPKSERDKLSAEIDDVSSWCVGIVKNVCETDVQLDGRTILVGGTQTVVFKDGHSEKGMITRSGYKPIRLPPDLNGRMYELREESFVANPVPVKFPHLDASVKCVFNGREMSGGETASLSPGKYSCTYRMGDDYEPQTVEFHVRVNAPTAVPEPTAWKHTREYLARENAREKNEREAQEKVKRDRVVSACRELMNDKPVETRRARLAEAEKLLAKAARVDRILSDDVVKGLESEIRQRQRRVVGLMRNACSNLTITVGGRIVEPGKTEMLVFADGLPKDWCCLASGYEKKELPRDFDGRSLRIGPDDLVAEAVSFALPELETGVSCHFEGTLVSRNLSLKPGLYACVYRKAGCEDQVVQFEVSLGKSGRLPLPGQWKLRPVKVAKGELSPDVTCLVDGVVVHADLMLSPGEHRCEFRRTDYQSQSKRFTVAVGTPTTLPATDEWEASPGLKNLNSAESHARRKDWTAAEKALADADVSSEDGRRRKALLEETIQKQAGLRKKAEQAIEYYDNEYYGDAVKYYFEACQLGYLMTDDDKRRVKYAYDVERKRLQALIDWTYKEIKIGRSVDRSVSDIEKEKKTLFERYNAVK